MITRILLVLSLIFNQTWALPVLKNRDNLFQGANAFTNFATNSDFDLAASSNASVQTGTGSISLNTTSKLKGKNSLLLTPNTGSNVFRFTTTMNDTTNANYLTGQTCEASFSVVGTSLTTGYAAYVTQGSTQVSQSYSFTANSTPSVVNNILFPCGDLANATYLDIAVTGTANAIYVDDIYVGLARNIGSVQQSTMIGSLKYASTANCTWRTTGAMANFGADTDCPTPTTTGQASAPATKIPAIVFNNGLPAGDYLFTVAANFAKSTNATDYACRYRVSDGTNSTAQLVVYDNVDQATGGHLVGKISYTTAQAGPVTFNVQGSSTSGAGNCDISAAANDDSFEIAVNFSPLSAQQIISQAAQGWFVAANISGANPSLGGADLTSYTEIANGSLTMTPVSGSQPVGIMCSSTNAAATPTTSTSTCSAGNESVGANFSIPTVGFYEVCLQAGVLLSTSVGASIDATFELIETPTNAQTITQEGKGRVNFANSVASSNPVYPLNLCGTFYFSSVGIKGVRLMGEQDITGTTDTQIKADGSATLGQRDILITVKPVTNGMPSPFVVGSVQSATTGVDYLNRAILNCDAASSITSQSGSWVSSIANAVDNGSNRSCAITLASGYSATPTCTFTVLGTTPASNSIVLTSATSITIYGPDADYDVALICDGPK